MADQPTPNVPNGWTERLKLLALTVIAMLVVLLGAALLLVLAGEGKLAEKLIDAVVGVPAVLLKIFSSFSNWRVA